MMARLDSCGLLGVRPATSMAASPSPKALNNAPARKTVEVRSPFGLPDHHHDRQAGG